MTVTVGGHVIGRDFVIIAGPCAVESEEQTLEVARRVKEAGAHMLRGGAYKPRGASRGSRRRAWRSSRGRARRRGFRSSRR